VVIVPKPPEPVPTIKKIAVSIYPLNFKTRLTKSLTEHFTVKLEEIINIRNAVLRFETPKNVLISPSRIKISKEKLENEKFKITFRNLKLRTKRFHIHLRSDEDILVQPSDFEFRVTVKEPLKIPLWAWLLGGIIVVMGLIFAYQRSIPRFDKEYLVQLDKEGNEIARWKLRRYQPTFSSTVTVSKNLRIQGIRSSAFALRKDKIGRIYIIPLETEVDIGGEKLPKKKQKKVEFNVIFHIGDKKLKMEKERGI